MLDVDDERVRGGPALQLEDLADGVGIRSGGAEAIDRFRRERDDLAFAQRFDRLVDLVLWEPGRDHPRMIAAKKQGRSRGPACCDFTPG